MLRFTETQGLPGDLCEMRYLWWLSCSFSSPPSNVNYTWLIQHALWHPPAQAAWTQASLLRRCFVLAAWAFSFSMNSFSRYVLLCPSVEPVWLCLCSVCLLLSFLPLSCDLRIVVIVFLPATSQVASTSSTKIPCCSITPTFYSCLHK